MPAGSVKRVHHLNAGTFKPWPGMFLVTHILLCEMEHGLVLVDTGVGREDIAYTTDRLGWSPRLAGAAFAKHETAANQIEALGYAAGDVTDVVATHLDYDHIGGLSDFPTARLHVTAVELAEATEPTKRTRGGQIRYRAAHIKSINEVVEYSECDTSVLDLAAHTIGDVEGIFLVPMPGHTAGHAAVAVADPHRGWLVHAGDAFMHRAALEPGSVRAPLSARAMSFAERLMASNYSMVKANHFVLQTLSSSNTRVFCSHDARQLHALANEEVGVNVLI